MLQPILQPILQALKSQLMAGGVPVVLGEFSDDFNNDFKV